MSQAEFERWIAYHRRTPLDDESQIYKPAALLAAVSSRSGKQPDYFLNFMLPKQDDFTDADASIFAAFGIKPPKG